MKKWLIVFPLWFFSVSAFTIPNPASIYCLHHGGKLVRLNESAGVVGICVFHDKSYCEEWSYTKGTCKSSEYYLPEERMGTKYCLIELPNKNLIIYLCKA